MTISNGTSTTDLHPNGTNGTDPASKIGSVRSADIVGKMQDAYLDYAMSVIVARALPDVRDGLKPVHRRILYAMYGDLGLTHDKPHKKSARIVGEVLGKYHPHGDVAVYDAMARMAQNFSLRYPLVDGQGNFGSIDGDSPAAMRYTEARLAQISDLMLSDIDKDTVEWVPNFDNSLEQPAVLPAALPNLLINGSNGIAVGMATNIPPHNLGEVVDALAFLIDNFAQIDEITVEQLLQFVKGPDFPTGGMIYRYRTDNKSEEEIDAIAQGYSVGRSRLVVQAKAHFEELSRGRSRIVITELPYQTNKSALIERIADLVRDGKIEGISDLRDESDRTGMRVVIELGRTAEPKAVLADLFKYTPLQQTFGMQLLALVDGQPRMLSLKRMLHLFIQHRQEIVRRRSEFDLRRARERAHIVEGLLKALDILDEVIATIRNSQRVDTARNNLVKNFGFTEIQAQAILDMQLRRLAAMERTRLKEEFKELKEHIAYLEELLAHPEKILALIKSELLAIKEQYGDARRTQIVERTKGTLTTTDLLPDQTVWVAVTSKGDLRRQEVGRVNSTLLRQIGRGSDVAVVTANTREPLYLFSSDGRSTRIAVHELPHDGGSKSVTELGKFNRGDQVCAALTLPKPSETSENSGYLCFVTEQGMVKRVSQADFLNAILNAPTVMAVTANDRMGWAFATQGEQEIILVTASGQAIRFAETDVRSMGLAAGGVGGIKLKGKDKVIYAGVVDPDGELITLTAQGYAKRSPLADYPSQGRNGGGIVTHKLNDRTGLLTAALVVPSLPTSESLLAVTRKGVPKLVTLEDIPVMGRSVLGKPIFEVTSTDLVTRVQRVLAVEATDPEDDTSSPTPDPSPAAAPENTSVKPKRAAASQVTAAQAPLVDAAVVEPEKPKAQARPERTQPTRTAGVKLNRVQRAATAAEAPQPSLFGEELPEVTEVPTKSSKVASVVSVPAAQASKRKSGRSSSNTR